MNTILNWLHKFLNGNAWWNKLGRAAYVAFLAVFIPGIITILGDVQTGHWSAAKDVFVGLVVAGFAAAVKAIEVLVASWLSNKYGPLESSK